MNEHKKDEKNFDGYITITNSLKNASDRVNISNISLITGINNGLIDAVKQIASYNLSITRLYSDEILKTQKMIFAMIEPLTEITKKIIELYDPIINNTFSRVTEIFEKIDWSQFDLIYKEIAIKYLSNGFYSYRNTEIKYEELLNTNSKKKQVKIIKEGIRADIKNAKNHFFLIYPKYKKCIKEIYNLYNEHNYRLCILSLINLISIINNTQFEYIDFTEKNKVRQKLLEKQIMKDKGMNYLVFAQYIEDDDLVNANELLKNYRKTPEEYLKVPYNRHAITHGYSKKFGNEINCLRWFSVLLNTLEISEKIIELEKEMNSQ